MRTLVTLGALALFGAIQPAAAQMCGAPAQQAQASMPAQGGMMCGGMMQQAADDPMADKPAEKPKATGMMCPCCRNMAMMRGGMQHDMPGMPGMTPPATPPATPPQ